MLQKFAKLHSEIFKSSFHKWTSKFIFVIHILFECFKKTVERTCRRHYPIWKKWIVQTSQAPLISKEINEKIIPRSRLRSEFLKFNSKLRNYWSSLIRLEKKVYVSKLNLTDLAGHKTFITKISFFEKNFHLVKHNLNLERQCFKGWENTNKKILFQMIRKWLKRSMSCLWKYFQNIKLRRSKIIKYVKTMLIVRSSMVQVNWEITQFWKL